MEPPTLSYFEESFRLASDCMILVDADQQRIVAANEAARSSLGYDGNKFATSLFDLIDAPLTEINEQLTEIMTKGTHFGHFSRWKKTDGSKLALETYAETIQDNGKTLLRLIGRASTDSSLGQQQVQEWEERYHTLLEHLPIGVYRTTLQGNIIEANQALLDMLGYANVQALQTKNVGELYADKGDRQQHLQKLEVTGTYFKEFQLVSGSGKPIWVRDYPRAIKDKQGTIQYMDGVLLDITDRKKAEDELKKSHDQLEELVEQRTSALKTANEKLIWEIAERRHAEALYSTLYQIAEKTTSAANIHELCRAIHHFISDLVYAKNFYICLIDEPNQRLRFVYAIDEKEGVPALRPLGKGFTEYVLQIGKPCLIKQEMVPEMIRQGKVEIIGVPAVDWLGVPLKSGTKTIGVVAIQTYSEDKRLGDREKELLTLVSPNIANAIVRKTTEEELESHRLHLETLVQERTRELASTNTKLQSEVVERKQAQMVQNALYQIVEKASSAEDLGELYAAVHKTVGELIYAKNFYIATYDETTDTISFPYFVDEVDAWSPPKKMGKGLTEYIIRNGQPLLAPPEVFNAMVERGEVELIGEPSLDWLGVPLKSGEKTFGVVVIQTYSGDIRLGAREKELLTFVSQNIANVIQRRRSEEELKRYRHHLEELVEQRTQELLASNALLEKEIAERRQGELLQAALYRITEKTHTAEDLHELYQAIHLIVGELMYAKNFRIALYDDVNGILNLAYFVDEFDTWPKAGRLGRGLTEYVIRHGTPLLLNQDHFTQFLSTGDVQPIGRPSVDWLGVPLKRGGKTFGAVVVQSYTEKNRLGEKEKELLTFVSYNIANAIERKRSEDNWRRYEFIANTSEDFMTLISTDYAHEAVNNAYCKAQKKAREEIIGRSLAEMWGDDIFRNTIQPHLDRCFLGEEVQFRAQFTMPEQEAKFYEVNLYPYHSLAGPVTHAVAVSHDITEQHLSEIALRTSEKKFRSVFENSRDTIYISTVAGYFQEINQAGVEMFGYPREELLKTHVSKLYYNPKSREDFKRIIHTPGFVQDFEVLMRKKDGSPIYTMETANVITDEKGEIVAYQGIIKDITERKAWEERLKLLQTAINYAAEAVIITNRQGLIQYVNPAFETITAYHKEEAIGKKPNILKSGQQTKDVYEQLWKTITGGKHWEGEFINRKKDGTLYNDKGTISPVFDEQGEITHFIGIKRDITQEKKLENQLLQAVKLESIGRLAGGIAHDFNNLLTIINGYTEVLISEASDGSIKDDLQEILKAGEKAAQLVHQILAFSRKQVVNPVTMDINHTARDLKKMIKRIIGEDIELKTIFARKLHQIKMDPTQLEQVIMNLVVNSRDAMPKGGRLTMQTENVSFEHETYSRNEAIPPGDYAMLSLSDTGSGMDKDTLDKIFEPFFTTKEQGKGTGLGLSTVYGIIKQNRGFISVYSEVGRGTTFKIYFPRHSAKRTTTKSLPRAEKAARLSTITVLLVEDEAGVRQLTEKMLHSFGMDVLVAASGEEAIRIARSRRKRIDLVLTDIVMSGKSGWEIAEIIPQFHPESKFLFSSGYPEKHAEKGNVKVSEGNYISKPYSKTELQNKIKKLLAIGSAKD